MINIDSFVTGSRRRFVTTPPAIAVLLNPFRGRQYDSALLSQVFHEHLAYLRDILLIRYIVVEEICSRAEIFSLTVTP